MKAYLLALTLFGATFLAGCLNETASPSARTPLPPPGPELPALKFNEFFETPIGPRGLTLSEKLESLHGSRIRILGFMVRNEKGTPGKFLFAAMPVQLHDHDSSDDLPAALVHVSVPTYRNQPVPYVPGLMLLTGTLSVGHQEEVDGRNSVVRLALDPPEAPSKDHFPRNGFAQQNARPGISAATVPSSAQHHQH